MTTLEKTLIEKIKHLPPEKQRDMLDYAETLEKPSDEAAKERSKSSATTWEMVKDIIEEIPEEEWAKIPADASINLGHYLYGHKKKSLI
jgi:hypothetical protein